jgi:hypothetical protein
LGEAKAIHQIGVVKHQVFHRVDFVEPFGLAEARMCGEIDRAAGRLIRL